MKVTLKLADGREMDFSEVKDIVIFEEHSEIKNVTQDNEELAQVPTEGKWFKVNPLAIEQELFREEREDSSQEVTRQLILKAFEVVEKDSKYGKSFKTLIPKKTWFSKTVGQLKELAESIGDHNADWVEQALEWAQRIANGETWEDICNKYDTANWRRLVVWNRVCGKLVGGSRKRSKFNPAPFISDGIYYDHWDVDYAVPLVVAYDE